MTVADLPAKDDDLSHCHVVEGKLALPYQYFAGRTGSRFLIALRDEKKILGIRCEHCGKVFVPPRKDCERCQSDLSGKWVELEGSGEVVSFTIVRYDDKHLPRKAPYALALIRLDGADTPLLHIVGGIDPERVTVGLRVRPVFAAATTSTILDIDHFAPIA